MKGDSRRNLKKALLNKKTRDEGKFLIKYNFSLRKTLIL